MTLITLETLLTTPSIYAKLRYVSPGHPVIPSTRPFGLPENSEFDEERVVTLHDIRPILSVDQLSSSGNNVAQLSSHGFTAVQHTSVMHSAPYTAQSWEDSELLKQVHVPEVEEMLRGVTGAKTVITEILLIRRGQTVTTISTNDFQQHTNSTDRAQSDTDRTTQDPAPTATPPPPPPPPQQQQGFTSKAGLPLTIGFTANVARPSMAPKVHVDFTPAGARIHIRNFHPTITAACSSVIAVEDSLLAAGQPLSTHYSTSVDAPRWAIYSVWRPLKPVKRDPLAVADMRSFAERDCVPVDVPGLTFGEDGQVSGQHVFQASVGKSDDKNRHRWCYISEQRPDEVLIVGLWDSHREGNMVGSGGAMHCSVQLEGQEIEEPRESLELRCLAIW